MSLIVTYLVHPILYNFIESNSIYTLRIVFIFFIIILFIDMFISIKRLIKFKQSLSSFHSDIKDIENYLNRFPTMSIKK